MLVFLLVDVEKGSGLFVGKELLKLKEVKNVHLLDKEVDIIVRIEIKDLSHLEKLIVKKIRPISSIVRTETLITF